MMNQEYKYMVRVSCLTFNQSQYIIDTLNGFVMQQTNFPFVVTIIDDASTDGEQEVVRAYVNGHFDVNDTNVAYEKETDYAYITYAQHKTNKNCYFAVLYLKENHYSQRKPKAPYITEWNNVKYIAVCEGDDYWIHPQKLQMQVDFLEENEEYVMCHTDFNLSNGKYRNHNVYTTESGNYFPGSIIYGNLQVGTLTVIYRKDVYDELPKLWIGKGWPMGDAPLWIEFSLVGKIKYLADVTANYRILPNSASHGTLDKEIAFTNANVEMRKFYADYYGLKIIDNGYSKGYFVTILKCAFKHRNKTIALEYKKLASKMKKTSWKMYVFYYATIFPLIGLLMRRILYSQE